MSENVTSKELSAKQKKAIAALLAGGTARASAKIAIISERQLYRWMQEDFFKRELQRASDDALAATVRALHGASTDAVRVLSEIQSNPMAKNIDKRAAASVILANSLRWAELHELTNRVAALERAQVKP